MRLRNPYGIGFCIGFYGGLITQAVGLGIFLMLVPKDIHPLLKSLNWDGIGGALAKSIGIELACVVVLTLVFMRD